MKPPLESSTQAESNNTVRIIKKGKHKIHILKQWSKQQNNQYDESDNVHDNLQSTATSAAASERKDST